MWSNWKMKFVVFIHNDDAKWFHMVVQGTHKLVMMDHINFEDHGLAKRQWASKKMNVTGRKFKDEKNKVTSKAICICCWKLCAFLKFWTSYQHEYKECD
jgi:hypothetical protein